MHGDLENNNIKNYFKIQREIKKSIFFFIELRLIKMKVRMLVG